MKPEIKRYPSGEWAVRLKTGQIGGFSSKAKVIKYLKELKTEVDLLLSQA